MKNLLKLGQGPRPDLLFEEEEKAKKSDTQPDGQKQKIELIWQQVVSKLGEEKFFSIPWGHHLYIISQCKEVNLFGERQLNNKTGNIYGR